MGATPYSDTRKNYYNVNGYQFTQRAAEGQSGAVMRKITKKDGSVKEVWELLYKDLSGDITSIDVKETDWGKQYEITLNDLGEVMVLQLNVESGYGDTFAARLPNVDLSKPVKLVPYSFVPDGGTRKKEGLNIFQAEVKIEPFFTKENPANIPSVEKLQAAGVMSDPPESGDWKMFYGLVHKFLAANTVEVAKKINKETSKKMPPNEKKNEKTSEYAPTNAPSDDLPF
jgi:hypothetical protein